MEKELKLNNWQPRYPVVDAKEEVRRRLYRNITPFGYHNPISRTLGAIVLNQQDYTRSEENRRIKDSVPEASALDAIWATYLNIPENQRRNINSKYGISKTKDGYYRFNNPEIIFNFELDLSPHGLFGSPGRKAVMMNGILGNYTTGLGRDAKGDYIFYSDSRLNPDGTPNIKTGWDINPYSSTVDDDTEETTEEHGQYGQDKKDLSYKIGKTLFGNVEDISMGVGTPVPIYDKIYLDDFYNVQWKDRGGYYLPEITIKPKYQLGGLLRRLATRTINKGIDLFGKALVKRTRRFVKRPVKTPKITPQNSASITPELWTAAQDAAIARGDMTEAQRLRDLHFKVKSQTKILDEDGNVLPSFHYSENKFTEFNPDKIGVNDPGFYGKGFYSSPNKNYASTYGENEYKLYINSKEPFKTNNNGDRSLSAFSFNRTDESPLIDIDNLNLRKELENADAVWQKGVAPIRDDKPIEEIVVTKPTQMKLADAVTYDNGIRIPLGERDNFNIKDIRYGLIPFVGLAGLTLKNK